MLTHSVLTIVLLSGSAQPASRPATQPTTEQQLRSIIAGLQQQVASLKADNAELRKRLAQQPKPATQQAKKPTPQTIGMGMSKQDVESITESKGTLISSEAEVQVYSFVTKKHVLDGEPPGESYELIVQFNLDQVTRFRVGRVFDH